MIHRKARSLMTPAEVMARVAATALTQASAQQTGPSGSISVPNSDGTRTVIGAVNTTGSTMATHVGDTTPPGVPTGISATSTSGMLTVRWDGTLTGGVPGDFSHVSVTIDGPDGTEALGSLTHAGDLTAAGLTEGETYRVTATAEDDACLADGTPAHNVSAATAPIEVTIAKSGGTDDEARRLAKEAMDAADATGQHFWADGSGAHVSTDAGNADGASNVLINALGILLRAAQNNLLGVTPSGITIYDGQGNDDANVVATFTGSGVELARNSISSTIKMCGGKAMIGAATGGNTSYVYVGTGTGFNLGETVVNGSQGAYLTAGGSMDGMSNTGIAVTSHGTPPTLSMMGLRNINVNGTDYPMDRFASVLKCPFPVGFVGMFSDDHKPTDLYPGTSWTKEDITFMSSVGNDMALDVQDGIAANGTNVWLWSENGTPAQRWWWNLPTEGARGAFWIRTA
jgi:hypothetical protein